MSEETAVNTLDAVPDGIIVHESESYTIVDVNEALLNMYDYDRSEVIGESIEKFGADGHKHSFKSTNDRISNVQDHQSTQFEWQTERADGEELPVEVNLTTVQSENEERIVASVREISEWKKRQKELKRSRELVEKTQENAGIGWWEIDLVEETLRWSDEVYRIHDVPFDQEVTIEDAIEFYHPDDRPVIREKYDQLTTAGESYDVELRIITADDRLRWVRTVGDPQFNDDGEVIGVLGTFQDITDQKEQRQELQNLNERLELAVDGANIGVWDWDMRTDELTFNDNWVMMLGYQPNDVGSSLDEWNQRIHPDDFNAVESAVEDHIAGEAAFYDTEHRMQTADDDWKWVRDIGKVFEWDDTGNPIRSVGIRIDIDERKQIEQQLQDQRDNLKILNKVVRHDVRNDLQLILAHADMVASHVESEAKEHIEKVVESGRDAVEITTTAADVTDVLLQSEADFSRKNLRIVILNQVEEVRANNEQAVITTSDAIPDVEVLADDMINSVFRNLLKNAILHNNKEIPKITVSGTTTEETVTIKIGDNGPGVPDELKEEIFEEGKTGLESDSTGLGLYLVQILLDRYNGTVEIEDNEPEGSVFTVELPRC
jgi:PAS domain S-box